MPRRAKQLIPGALFIVVLRDPAERAVVDMVSHYRHMSRELDTRFREALSREEERVKPDFDIFAENPLHRFAAALRFSYTKRGNYVVQLEQWFSYHPPERFLILAFREFLADPGECVSTICTFLGVRCWAPKPFPNDSAHRGSGGTTTGSRIPDDLRAQLTSEFATQNERLIELTGRSFSWM